MTALGKTLAAVATALVTAGAIGLGAMNAAASSDDYYRYGKRYYDDDAYEYRYRYRRYYDDDRYEYRRKYYRSKCGSVRGKWMSPRKAVARLEAKGFRVYRLKSDDGCYEAKARDARGRRVEIYMNPVSGKIVRIKRKS